MYESYIAQVSTTVTNTSCRYYTG